MANGHAYVNAVFCFSTLHYRELMVKEEIEGMNEQVVFGDKKDAVFFAKPAVHHNYTLFFTAVHHNYTLSLHLRVCRDKFQSSFVSLS